MDKNPISRAESFICDGCPAVYDLVDYAERADRKEAFKGEMERNESVVAEQALNGSARKVD